MPAAAVMNERPVIHHIPVCPFSQRLEILLELKGLAGAVDFRVVDITRPRPASLLAKTRGSTALPVLELEDGRVIKESLVILNYLDRRLAGRRIEQNDPYGHAVEAMLIALEGGFANAGYAFVMNQDPAKRDGFAAAMDAQYARIDDFLCWQSPDGVFLSGEFGLAETVFTPLMARFWFLEYYESYQIPADLSRVRRWSEACLAHKAAQQVSREEIIKLYYDYAFGAGNGALLPGRTRSSFAFDPHWRERPWPPREKYCAPASDVALGLI